MDVSQFYRNWFLPIRLVGKSQRTIQAYGSAVGQWSRFSDVSMAEIDTRLIAGWQASLLANLAAATVNSYCRELSAILNYAVEEKLIERLPKVQKIREPKRVPLALTIEEFGKVLRAASHEKRPALWRACLLTAWETGLRLTALLSVRPSDVVWESSRLYCQADEQKTKEAQWFQLQPETLAAIRSIWSMENERLFSFRRKPQTLTRNLRRILSSCGIYAPIGQGLVWHRIRRSKASYTELAGGSAMKALGHSKPSITARYLDPRIVGVSTFPPMPMPTS